MNVSDDRRLDRLRTLDPLARGSAHRVDADEILAAVERRRTAGRRRHHRRGLVAAAVAVLVAVVALPLATSPVSRAPEALLLPASVRVDSQGVNNGYALNTGSPHTLMPVAADYVLSLSGTARTQASSAEAGLVWSLAWREPLAPSARRLALALGIRRDAVTVLRRDAHGVATVVRAGAAGGPSVVAAAVHGTVRWSFHAKTARVELSGSSFEGAVLWASPVRARSVDRARAVLHALRLPVAISAAHATRSGAVLAVAFQVLAGGRPTDLTMRFTFAPGGSLTSASGVLATLSPKAAYASVSLAEALGELRSAARCAVVDLPPGGRTVTVHVVLQRATPRLATFAAEDGTSLLVPVWRVVGRAAAPAAIRGQSFLADVVDARPVVVAYAPPRICPSG